MILEILIGNIGAGKSTYCKDKVKQDYIIISRDDIRYSIGAGEYIFNVDYEVNIKNAVMELFDSFICNNEVDIIIDETNMNKACRDYYLQRALEADYTCMGIVFPKLSKEKSINRRLQNNHGNTPKEIWEGVWEMFDRMYEAPTTEEGFDEIIYLEENQ